MLPKILILFINLFAIKTVFSQAVYGTSPTYAYSSTPVPSAQTYPAKVSPSTSVSAAVPATLTSVPASSSPATSVSSPTASSSTPVLSVPVSPSSEVKAYFLPGPIPDPKVTILSDTASVTEAKSRLSPHHSVIELNRASDPGFIEVIGKFCDPKNTIQGVGIKPVLPAVKESTVSPVKRLTMACSDNKPLLPVDSLSYLKNENIVCPGISKIDFVTEGTINNPIECEGLLNGFFTYLEV